VSVELINAADGSAQWSQRYDRPYEDLFGLQDDITRAVAGALKAKLLPGEHAAAQSERPPSGSLAAYNAYLEGQFYYAHGTEADFRKAIEYYTQATQLDPRYALAWSELSQTWTDLTAQFLDGAPALEAYAKARAAVDRALSLSPELAEAHLARADLLSNADFDWRGAETEVRRATELAPNDGEAKFYAQAALAAARQEAPGLLQDIALALARQIGGDRAAADAALKMLMDKDAGVASYQIAEVYALRDDDKETFAWLDRAWTNRDPGIQQLLYDPFILRFKDDPRFAAFCRKVRLPVPGAASAGKST
jgi:tetratricopeptide (TPR) repeat protein